MCGLSEYPTEPEVTKEQRAMFLTFFGDSFFPVYKSHQTR